MAQSKDDIPLPDREYLIKALDAADFARMNAGTLSNRELAEIVVAAKWVTPALAALEQIAAYEISDNLNYYNARRMIEIARETLKNAALATPQPTPDAAEGAEDLRKDIKLIWATVDRAAMASRSHRVPPQVTRALIRIEAALYEAAQVRAILSIPIQSTVRLKEPS